MSARHTPLVLLGTLFFAGCGSPPQPDVILVGHLAPRGGAAGDLGERARNGIILAADDVNRDDQRILGRRVEVRHADTRGGEAAAADETVRLIAVTRAVALLGATDPATADRIARAALPYAVPLVTPSPLPPPAADNAFSTDVSPTFRGQVLARFAVEELKAKHAVVLADGRSPVAEAVASAFAKEFARADGRRAERVAFDSDAALNDLKGRLAKTGAGALLFAGNVRDLGKARDHLPPKDLPVLFGGEGEPWPDGAPGRGAAYAVTTFVVDPAAPRAEEFAKRYRERFKEEPDAHAASAYEGAALLFEAMRRARSAQPGRVREALAGLDGFESLTGPLTLDRDDRHARRAAFVVTRDGDKVRPVRRYDAGQRQ